MKRLPSIEGRLPVISPSPSTAKGSFSHQLSNSSSDVKIMRGQGMARSVSDEKDEKSSRGQRAKKILKIVIIVLATLQLLYYVIASWCHYGQYAVETSSTTTLRAYIAPPVVTICAESAEILDESKLGDIAADFGTIKTGNPDRMDFVYKANGKLAPAFTIAELDAMTPAFEALFPSAKVRTNESTTVGDSSFTAFVGNITTYFKGTLKCFTLTTDRKEHYKRERVFDSGKYTGVYMILDVSKEFAARAQLQLFINGRGEGLIYGSDQTPAFLNLKKTRHVKLDYHTTREILLRYPYVTNCQCFRASGYNTSAEMLNAAYIARSKSSSADQLPWFVVQPRDSKSKVIPEAKADTDPAMAKIVTEMREKAMREAGYKKDCTQDTTIVREIERVETDAPEATKILIALPSEPEMTTKYDPVMTFSDLACKIFGAVGSYIIALCVVCWLSRRGCHSS